MKRIVTLYAAIALMLVTTSTTAVAAQYGGIKELYVYPFLQNFKWAEYTASGGKLLTESGFLGGVGGVIKLSLLQGNMGALTVNGKMEVFGGRVDYDGQYQNGTTASTDVDYSGITEEVTVGWEIPIKKVTLEPFTGLGYRYWLRDIRGSGGYEEQWSSSYLLLGLRNSYKISENSKIFLMGGAKYAFYNENNIDHFPGVGEVNVEPAAAWSAQAEIGFKIHRIITSFYYESFLFHTSPRVRKTDYSQSPAVQVDIWQPHSESEVIGFRVGWAFR